MPTTVYTLLCQTDRTGHVLGVFADRAHAAEIARANAAMHAEKLRRQDEKTFKAPVAGDVYQVHVEDLDSDLTVFIRHRFLDEPETCRWLVHGFEIVTARPEATRQRDISTEGGRQRRFRWNARTAVGESHDRQGGSEFNSHTGAE